VAGYENGKVDFATLIDAQRQIRQARARPRIKAQAEAQIRLAEVERLAREKSCERGMRDSLLASLL
jgi:cobalt-zinc-cadmium efflux system outer membrane protein